MFRIFFRRINNNQAKLSCTQLSNPYSTKSSGDKGSEIPNFEMEPESPGAKIMKFFKGDGAFIKDKLSFCKENKNPVGENGKVLNYDDPRAPIFPNHCDIVIIGGGAMGSSIAFWAKVICRGNLRIVVVERDPMYKKASTVLSVGGLRQQFSLEENIEMSLFGAEFVRNANDYLGIQGEPKVDLQFQQNGYLFLSTEETAAVLKHNSDLQNSKGAKNVLLSPNQLKSKFPWLTTEDIKVGCLGLENEGWFDPWSLLCALKRKAISLGVEYVTAEAKGFHFKKSPSTIFAGCKPGEYEGIEYVVVETEDGVQRPITFSKCIIAAGAFSGQIAKMAKIGYGENVLSVPLPVEPRKRYVYCFHAPDGPGLNTPMTIDPKGLYFRREGLNNHYICGLNPGGHDEPPVDNLDVDPEFFDNKIWPILAHRVKAFENLKVKSSWAGYYEYNTFDENGIIGHHPYHHNIIFATGFSGHGIQKAPAVGRAVSELLEYSTYQTIDLSRLSFERFITQKPIVETNIW